MQRITALDVVRGFVMVVMALDHTRDFLHTSALSADPLDFNTTTPALFLTRWITHLCAPTFVFLAGMSAYLALKNATDVAAARSLLLKRGLWLILLELTVINFALWFDVQFRTTLFQVIFAIGFGLVVVSQASRLSANALGIIGLLIILLHGQIPPANPEWSGAGQVLWSLFFKFGVFPLSADRVAMVLYPVVPWLGILLLGYGCGQIYSTAESGILGMRNVSRQRALLLVGGVLLLLFVAMRTFNTYGDPRPWGPQSTPVFSALSFVNVSKYPPSAQYATLMVGLGCLLLAWSDRASNAVTRFLAVYGKVPLFYYVVHWYVIHTLVVVLLFATGHTPTTGPIDFGRPVEWGFSLPVVYAIWASVVLSLYPLCRWFGRYKHENSAAKPWLRYV